MDAEPPAAPASSPGPLFSDRLDFVLPTFKRVSWVSAQAERLWGPRCRRLVDAWTDIEVLAVRERMRDAATVARPAPALRALATKWVRDGLHVEVVSPRAPGRGGDGERRDGRRLRLRAFVGRDAAAAAALARAWRAGAHGDTGGHLGYPDCCRAFFAWVRDHEHCVDTTWAVVSRSVADAATREARIPAMWETNIFWMPLGVRAVPHVPCRFGCAQSVALAARFCELGRASGYAEEMRWLGEILSWSVQWSALHGIAETKTPILKMSSRTDATAAAYAVFWEGAALAQAGATGLGFPHRASTKTALTRSDGYRRGLANLSRRDPPAPN